MAQFALELNGRLQIVEIDGEKPLLRALRDLLNLTEAKYRCGVHNAMAGNLPRFVTHFRIPKATERTSVGTPK